MNLMNDCKHCIRKMNQMKDEGNKDEWHAHTWIINTCDKTYLVFVTQIYHQFISFIRLMTKINKKNILSK